MRKKQRGRILSVDEVRSCKVAEHDVDFLSRVGYQTCDKLAMVIVVVEVS